MGIRYGRSASAVLALLLVVGVTGCVRGADQEYKAGFSELPAHCSDALKPAAQAIKAFAGEAYSAVAASQDADREVGDSSQDLDCALKFGGSVLRAPLKPYRTPMWRNVSISYYLSLLPISAKGTHRDLVDYVPGSHIPGSPRTAPIVGIGEDALTWVKEGNGDPPRVGVIFSIDNLIVTVETWGKDWSGVPETFPIVDSPELRADLRIGSEAIAKSLAQQAPSALPTAMLTMPPLTSHTSAPTTTKVAAPAWDPCQISDVSLTGAGLDVGSTVRHDESSDYGMCMWSGGWFRLRVYSSSAPFEWSAYESSTYVGPKPVTIGGRHGVQLHWRGSDLYCVFVFELPVEANLPDKGGRTLTFEASLTEDRTQTALCDALTRVTQALAGSLPPTT